MDTSMGNQRDEIDEAVIDLDPDRVIGPQGNIKATVVRRVPTPQGIKTWKYLKPGRIMDITAGSAIYAKTGSEFILAQFFHQDTITGPLVFADAKIEDPKVALRNSTDFDMEVIRSCTFIVVWLLTAVLFNLTSQESEIEKLVSTGASLVSGLGCGWNLSNLFKALRTGYYKDASAIKKMMDLRVSWGGKGLSVALPDSQEFTLPQSLRKPTPE